MINLPEVVGKRFTAGMQMSVVGQNIEKTMSLFATDMNRATHYNTLEELVAIRMPTHMSTFNLDRTVYGCIACLPGTTDFTKMTVIANLLGITWNPGRGYNWVEPILTMDHERMIIDLLVSTLPPNRMLTLFSSFEDTKINNARMRKTVLPFILNSNNLGWWSVKYRKKLKTILSHCWGRKMTSVVKSILGKDSRTYKEKDILTSFIFSYLTFTDKNDIVEECISFIMSAIPESDYTQKLFKDFYGAKTDFSRAKGLPKEIIEGIRSTYHPTIEKAETLKVAESSMTGKEKRLVQNQAKKAGVKVKWSAMEQPLVELLIYGFKMGFTSEIIEAIHYKAKKASEALPFNYKRVGIICDDSFSMSGSSEQKQRALAITYATVEMLKNVGETSDLITTSNRRMSVTNKPAGETNLAKPLISVLKFNPDVIFVVSDGYENAPEGRFGEVLKIARDKLKIDIPIYHFNPVPAAESKTALKRLSESVAITPVTNPEKMGLSLFKTMICSDPRAGIIELFNKILPELEKTKQLYARKSVTALTE
jgi:hypothetical protein